ncbi:MAG TPA: MBL fold metallo-hydrolase, partial [Candidatus Paceibacterota bacterium]|nr:MBL fold metallo-hydrolase [Candidatus Paceibacterota bacterium]
IFYLLNMIITWLGHSFFKIETKNKVIAIDPYSEESVGLKPPRFKTDILLISHNHEDHNNKQTILGEPFVLGGLGEIEIDGIFVEGILSYHDDNNGKYRGLNTIFIIYSEGMKLCFLGDLGEKKLKEESLQKVSNADILFIPIGGNYTVSSEEAVSLTNQIEPKIVIPMHYKIKGSKIKLDTEEKFLKALSKKPEVLDKLSIRKTQLPQETKLVLLKPLNK